jgi:hypothetical protein
MGTRPEPGGAMSNLADRIIGYAGAVGVIIIAFEVLWRVVL